jgi:hypothetical protein
VIVTNAPATGLPEVVNAVPDKLELHALALFAPIFTVAVAGVNGVIVVPAVAVPVASTTDVLAASSDNWNTGPVGQELAVGRKHSSGLPPTAVIRALTSPYSERPLKATVKVGRCPEVATARVEMFTVLGAVDGIATFVQPVIAEPASVLMLNVADV